MEEIPGQLEGSIRYVYEGYVYHEDRGVYRCAWRVVHRCPGRAVITLDFNVVILHMHNHAPQPFIIERQRMREELFRLSRETLTPLRIIFDEISLRQPEAVAIGVSFNSVRSAMERERALARPPIPQTLRELSEVQQGYAVTLTIFRGPVIAEDGSCALIFASALMLERLNRAHVIYADATFRIVPHRPAAMQLYTVHIRVMDIVSITSNPGFPVAYVLFERRTAALYQAVWRRIVQLAPGLRENAREVMGDFERAAIIGIRQILPGIIIRGCWFHFNQAILRRWSRLGLDAARSEVVNMAMGLPLAPVHRFREGLTALSNAAERYVERYPNIFVFLRYLRRQWAPLAPVLSVFGAPLRTNNLCETFHRRTAARLVGPHPNIWVFLENLVQLIASEDLDLLRVESGQSIRRPMRHLQRQEDARIRDAQLRLESGRYSIEEFLRAVVNQDQGAELQRMVRIGQVNVDEEIELAGVGDLRPFAEPQADRNVQAFDRIGRRARGQRREVENGPEQAIQGIPEAGRGFVRPAVAEADNGIAAGVPARPESPVFPAVFDDDDPVHRVEMRLQRREELAVPPPPAVPDAANRTDDAPWECIGCITRNNLVVILPCGHTRLCKVCVKRLSPPTYPFCRGPIRSIVVPR